MKVKTIYAVSDCGHVLQIVRADHLVKAQVPFDLEKARLTGSAHLPGPCPSCAGAFGPQQKRVSKNNLN